LGIVRYNYLLPSLIAASITDHLPRWWSCLFQGVHLDLHYVTLKSLVPIGNSFRHLNPVTSAFIVISNVARWFKVSATRFSFFDLCSRKTWTVGYKKRIGHASDSGFIGYWWNSTLDGPCIGWTLTRSDSVPIPWMLLEQHRVPIRKLTISASFLPTSR